MAVHEMKIRVMKTVSEGTKEIIKKRVKGYDIDALFQKNAALALVHSDVCDMIYISDLAQKASDVQVFEITGTCPTHMVCLGILGAASAVDEAVKKVRSEIE